MKWNPNGGTGALSGSSGCPGQPHVQPQLPAGKDVKSSGQLVQLLAAHKLITGREARLLDYFLHVLGDHVSEENKEQIVRNAYQLLQEEE